MNIPAVVLALVVANAIAIGALLMRPARGGELMLCHLEPADSAGWHYRTKVGGLPQFCWYQGKPMKPRRELYWAEAPAIPPAVEEAESPINRRWPRPDGWEHKE